MKCQIAVIICLVLLNVLATCERTCGDDGPATAPIPDQVWNVHIQNTDIVGGYPAFSAKYSGPNSLDKSGDLKDTESLDVYGGLRLWGGAEAHVDGLLWHGFGFSNTHGVEDFPNNEAFKTGARIVDFSFARIFIHQTIGFGGQQEDVPDDQLTLGGKRDISRLTVTVGRLSPADIFDTNSYSNSALTQFLGWGFVNNPTWDYPADSIGFTTGIAAELNQRDWTLRYGFYQMPSQANFWTADDRYLTFPLQRPYGDGEFVKSWGMALEFERRYSIGGHPGAIRPMVWLNEAHMGNYREALSVPGTDITQTRKYRVKYGFGLNIEQEIANSIGIFSRLGWNDGHEEAWTYTDVNYSAQLGMSVKGASWQRPDDTVGLAGMINGASRDNQRFLEAGGLGILDGDGRLRYGTEKVLETYYDLEIVRGVHLAFDYQFIANPAFNRDRGPVSVLAARLHWQF